MYDIMRQRIINNVAPAAALISGMARQA